MRKPVTPSYRLHKPSGQAVVRLDGRDHYLGKWDTPESRVLYDRLISTWLANGRQLPATEVRIAGPTVGDILDAYEKWAGEYYRREDQDHPGNLVQTPQVYRVRTAMQAVRDTHGDIAAREFGPLALRAVRQRLIDRRLARPQINSLIGVVRHAFRWAASREMIPATVVEALRTVEGLKRGRCEAREPERVLPVPENDLEPALSKIVQPAATIARLQLLTAARPGELLDLRPAELDATGKVWTYRPRHHKTSHHGRERVIWIGPQGQALLWPYLFQPVLADPTALLLFRAGEPAAHALHDRLEEIGAIRRPAEVWCFSPREAQQQRQRDAGQKPETAAGYRYAISSYVRAIRHGCQAAKVTPWRPHRLRHSAATRLVSEFGWRIAQIILGHHSLDATRIYADDDARAAMEAMLKRG